MGQSRDDAEHLGENLLAVITRLAQTVRRQGFQSLKGHRLCRSPQSSQLIDDLEAAAIFLEHACNTACLPFNRSEPSRYCRLLCRIDVRRRCGGHSAELLVTSPHLGGVSD